MGILCGTDIIEISRIAKALETNGSAFVQRVYTENEIAYCEQRKGARIQSYAARFAAKEALSKALGTGITAELNWKDIEVGNDSKGKPYFIPSDRFSRQLSLCHAGDISLSLSHCNTHAIATVVILTKD